MAENDKQPTPPKLEEPPTPDMEATQTQSQSPAATQTQSQSQTSSEVVPPKKGMSLWVKLLIFAVLVIVVIIVFISFSNRQKTVDVDTVASVTPMVDKPCETQRANLEVLPSWGKKHQVADSLTSSGL